LGSSGVEAAAPLALTGQEPPASSSLAAEPSVDVETRRAAVALHLLIDEDTTGLGGVLAVRIAEVLAQSPDAQEQRVLFADVRTLLERAREAKSPSQLLEVLDSPEGRRHALFARMPAWDPVHRAFTGGIYDPLQGPPAVLQLKQELLSGRSLTEADLIPMVAALAGRPESADVVQRVFDAVPAEHRATVSRLIAALTEGGTDPDRARRLSENVVDLATSAITQRMATLQAARANRDPAPWTADLDALVRGDATSRSLISAAGLAEGLARTLGDERLAQDIARTQRQVRSAMQVYEGLALLAGGGPGGALAVLSLLDASSPFGPRPNDDQSAALRSAIADLTALVRQEFRRVNTRLDTIDATLAAMSRELRDLKDISTDTQRRVGELQDRLGTLVGALPRFEETTKRLIVEVPLVRCQAIRLSRDRPSDREFHECLGLYQLLAIQTVTLQSMPADLDAALIKAFPGDASRTMEGSWVDAHLVAAGAASHFGLDSVRPYAKATPSPLSSAAFLTHGLTGYMDWVDRFGGERFAASIKWDGLQRLAFAAQQQEAFRAALRLEPAHRNEFMVRLGGGFAQALNDQKAAEAMGRIRRAARGAITTHILQPIVDEQLAQGRYPSIILRPCPGTDTRFTSFSFNSDRLPYAALLFRSHGASPWAASHIPALEGGLSACMNVLEASFDDNHNGRNVGSHAVVEVRFELGGEPACAPQRGRHAFNGRISANMPESPPLLDMAFRAAERALDQCFQDWSVERRRTWFGGLAQTYFDKADDRQLAAALGAAAQNGTLTVGDLEAATKPLAARFALLRGYLTFAYPEIVAHPPEGVEEVIRGWLDPPAAPSLLAYHCAWLDERQLRSQVEQPADPQCSGSPFPEGLPAALLRDLPGYARKIDTHLPQALAKVDWSRLRAGEVAPTEWVGRRVQAFIADGRSTAYWNALPPTAPDSAPASPVSR
jgi:hypothetical protein